MQTSQATGDDNELFATTRFEVAGKRCIIVDGVIAPEARANVFRLASRLPYQLLDKDRPDAPISHLLHRFSVEDTTRHPLIAPMVGLAENLLAKEGLDYTELSRVYANFNLFGDYQLVHTDGDEWTVLFFLNDEWREEWGGELLMYQGDNWRSNAVAVAPLPGRVIVFDGQILHRGGVPSKFFTGPRISLAIKFRRQVSSAAQVTQTG